MELLHQIKHLTLLDVDLSKVRVKHFPSEQFPLGMLRSCSFDGSTKTYLIEVSDLCTPSELPRLLAHELKHIEQRMAGRLKHISRKLTVWNKVYYYPEFMSYLDFPWEIEARAFEEEYLTAYNALHGNQTSLKTKLLNGLTFGIFTKPKQLT